MGKKGKSKKHKTKSHKTFKLIITIVKFVLLLCIIIGIPAFVYFQYPEFVQQFSSMEGVNAFLDRNWGASMFIYVALQIIQIVISFIPGQFVQFAGGYAYRFWLGYILSMIGIFFGTILTYYIAKILGKDAIHLILGEERVSKYVKILNSKRAFVVLFFLFVLPGFPKDLITYAAGLSEFKLKPFLILSMAGRTPALMGTIMMGAMLRTESYFGMIILGIIAVVLCILCIIFRDRLMKKIDKAYIKLTSI